MSSLLFIWCVFPLRIGICSPFLVQCLLLVVLLRKQYFIRFIHQVPLCGYINLMKNLFSDHLDLKSVHQGRPSPSTFSPLLRVPVSRGLKDPTTQVYVGETTMLSTDCDGNKKTYLFDYAGFLSLCKCVFGSDPGTFRFRDVWTSTHPSIMYIPNPKLTRRKDVRRCYLPWKSMSKCRGRDS